jgi:hypothetical protein
VPIGDSKINQIRRAHGDMLKREHEARIGAAPIFSGLSASGRDALASVARRVNFAARETVIREGDTGTACCSSRCGSRRLKPFESLCRNRRNRDGYGHLDDPRDAPPS